MKTTHFSTALPAFLVILALGSASCGGGGGDGGTDFNAFVAGQVTDNTSDTAEPVQINGADFEFSEDEHAFDSLFQ